MTRLLVALLAGLFVFAATAHAKTDRPIVYVIVIDGLDGDQIDSGAAPFISSLLAGQDAQSTYYPESRSVMITETNPNHTAMMSGAYAGGSGIPSNAFAVYHSTPNEDSCEKTGETDFSKMPIEVSGENANCPLVQFVFEAIKRQGNPDSLLTAAIFGKPKLGRIFAGKNVSKDQRDVDHIWAPCASGADDDDYCADIQTNPVSGYAMSDTPVMDEVLRTVREGIGPEDNRRRPDFTFVNLHQVDSVGHATNPMSPLYRESISMADAEVERLVTELRTRGEWPLTTMILLSDHSMDSTLTKTRMTETFGGAGIPDDAYLAIGKSAVDLIYLADRTSAGRFKLLKQMREAALASGNVTEALYRENNPEDGGAKNTIAGMHPAWHLTGSERVPDLLLTHKPGGSFSDPEQFSQPLPGHHGATQTADNFFAVIGGGPFVKQQTIPGEAGPLFDDTMANPMQAENVDPAATVMGLFGLAAPANNAGRFLSEAFNLSELPGRGAPDSRASVRVKKTGGGKGRGCKNRRYRAKLGPAGARFDVTLKTGKKAKRLGRSSMRRTYRFKVREGRRATFSARVVTAAGVGSVPTKKKIDLRRAC
jgi:hypothetical protein